MLKLCFKGGRKTSAVRKVFAAVISRSSRDFFSIFQWFPSGGATRNQSGFSNELLIIEVLMSSF
jgi:hypothetical protein